MVSLKVLIADSSIEFRDIFKKVLESLKHLEVIGAVPNGKLAMDHLDQHKTDLILISANLPDTNTNDFTKNILLKYPEMGVIIAVIEDDANAANMAVDALSAGAFDFILKPAFGKDKSISVINRKIGPIIQSFSIRHYSRIARNLSISKNVEKKIQSKEKLISTNVVTKEILKKDEKSIVSPFVTKYKERKFKIVLVGISTGGPDALGKLIPKFPSSFPLPIVIVIHMPKLFTKSMAGALNKRSQIKVKEAFENEKLNPNTAYIAQGGMHLAIQKQPNGDETFNLDDGLPENGCKPAVDVLFRSAADVFKENNIAVIMTGMGTDGTKGLEELKKYNVPVIAQDKESSVVWGMPGNAVQNKYVDSIVPLDSIASQIMEIVY